MINVDADIPLPPKGTSPGSERRYPFAEMELNDSFLVEYPPGRAKRYTQNSVLAAANKFRRDHQPDWEFTTRRMADGVRCWRVK